MDDIEIPMCLTCRYRYYDSDEDVTECRRNPPTVIVDDIGYGITFPAVFDELWCGEHEVAR